MEGFERVLRQVDRRLEAPEPERSRILLEMAGHLEDLYETYRSRGIGEASASLVWGGVRVALITTAFGLIVLAVAMLAWFALRTARRRVQGPS